MRVAHTSYRMRVPSQGRQNQNKVAPERAFCNGEMSTVLCEQSRKLSIQQRSIAQVEGKQPTQMTDAVEVGFVADDADLTFIMMRNMPCHAHTDIFVKTQFEQAGSADADFGSGDGNQRATQGQIEHAARPLTEASLKGGRAAKADARITSALDGDHADSRLNVESGFLCYEITHCKQFVRAIVFAYV